MADEGSSSFEERVSDLGSVTVSDGDWTTSDAALAVLRSRGVGAWRRWCRANRPGGALVSPTPQPR